MELEAHIETKTKQVTRAVTDTHHVVAAKHNRLLVEFM